MGGICDAESQPWTQPYSPMNHSQLYGASRLAVGVLIAVLVVRTWLAMGLVVPVTVAGSSMAPTLQGPHRTFRCGACSHEFPVGLDQRPPDDWAVCPHCGQRRAVAVADHGGAHVVVNRAAFAWQSPRRWEVIVFHRPEMADQLCVKRVVGLPGETVSLADGDVWIDGRRIRKTLAQQQALRQLVHRLAVDVRVVSGPDPSEDLPALSRWRWESGRVPDDVRWLTYRQPGDGPITDDLSYNQRASYEIHPLQDLMLTFRARLAGDGQLRLKVADSGGAWIVTWDARRQSVQLCRGTEVVAEKSLPPPILSAQARAEWTLSLFDRQVLLAIDGRAVIVVPSDVAARQGADDSPAAGPLAIGVAGLQGEIRDLAVWHDVYYESRPGDRPVSLAGATGGYGWRLGPGEYFVLGDNAAVSDDSRSWLAGPGLDAKLVIGKPLGVR
jgi:signal peptidase I